MTKLDMFEPEGVPIHPYDLYEILESLTAREMGEVHILRESPVSEDEEDYLRNKHKLGGTISIDGKKYFQTTTVPYKTKRIW